MTARTHSPHKSTHWPVLTARPEKSAAGFSLRQWTLFLPDLPPRKRGGPFPLNPSPERMAKSGNIKGIDWPAEKVERRPVESLIPYKNNARTHSESQVAQIAASIKEYGFTVPVLIDPKGNVIAGHGRIMAAKALGLAEIPVMVAKGWSAAKRRAYVILDNQVALNAGWDQDLLKLELLDLGAEGYSPESLGFTPGELDATGGAPGLIEEPPASKYTEQYGVIVVCASEDEQRKVYEQLNSEGMNCRVVTT